VSVFTFEPLDSSLTNVNKNLLLKYRSHVTCTNCKNESVTFDPYNSLSLPIPIKNTKTLSITVKLLPVGSMTVKINIEVSLYICICVCICCVYVYVYIYIYIHMCIYMYVICIHIYRMTQYKHKYTYKCIYIPKATMIETVGSLKQKIAVKLIALGYLTENHVIGMVVDNTYSTYLLIHYELLISTFSFIVSLLIIII
jgi:hypothetical protein